MLADDILSRSAADIAALYRSKRISPVEVVTATLDRIDRIDRLYNAFVTVDSEGALRDARASEERWLRGEPNGLVDGLPITVKDLIPVKGMPTRVARARPVRYRATKMVRRLRECVGMARFSWGRQQRRSSAGRRLRTVHSRE